MHWTVKSNKGFDHLKFPWQLFTGLFSQVSMKRWRQIFQTRAKRSATQLNENPLSTLNVCMLEMVERGGRKLKGNFFYWDINLKSSQFHSQLTVPIKHFMRCSRISLKQFRKVCSTLMRETRAEHLLQSLARMKTALSLLNGGVLTKGKLACLLI